MQRLHGSPTVCLSSHTSPSQPASRAGGTVSSSMKFGPGQWTQAGVDLHAVSAQQAASESFDGSIGGHRSGVAPPAHGLGARNTTPMKLSARGVAASTLHMVADAQDQSDDEAGGLGAMGDGDEADALALTELQSVYHLPSKEAARALNVSLSRLKRSCRAHNVLRWPHRKLSSLYNLQDTIRNDKNMKAADKERILTQINGELSSVTANPDHVIDSRLDEIRQAKYKLKYYHKTKHIHAAASAARKRRTSNADNDNEAENSGGGTASGGRGGGAGSMLGPAATATTASRATDAVTSPAPSFLTTVGGAVPSSSVITTATGMSLGGEGGGGNRLHRSSDGGAGRHTASGICWPPAPAALPSAAAAAAAAWHPSTAFGSVGVGSARGFGGGAGGMPWGAASETLLSGDADCGTGAGAATEPMSRAGSLNSPLPYAGGLGRAAAPLGQLPPLQQQYGPHPHLTLQPLQPLPLLQVSHAHHAPHEQPQHFTSHPPPHHPTRHPQQQPPMGPPEYSRRPSFGVTDETNGNAGGGGGGFGQPPQLPQNQPVGWHGMGAGAGGGQEEMAAAAAAIARSRSFNGNSSVCYTGDGDGDGHDRGDGRRGSMTGGGGGGGVGGGGWQVPGCALPPVQQEHGMDPHSPDLQHQARMQQQQQQQHQQHQQQQHLQQQQQHMHQQQQLQHQQQVLHGQQQRQQQQQQQQQLQHQQQQQQQMQLQQRQESGDLESMKVEQGGGNVGLPSPEGPTLTGAGVRAGDGSGGGVALSHGIVDTGCVPVRTSSSTGGPWGPDGAPLVRQGSAPDPRHPYGSGLASGFDGALAHGGGSGGIASHDFMYGGGPAAVASRARMHSVDGAGFGPAATHTFAGAAGGGRERFHSVDGSSFALPLAPSSGPGYNPHYHAPRQSGTGSSYGGVGGGGSIGGAPPFAVAGLAGRPHLQMRVSDSGGELGQAVDHHLFHQFHQQQQQQQQQLQHQAYQQQQHAYQQQQLLLRELNHGSGVAVAGGGGGSPADGLRQLLPPRERSLSMGGGGRPGGGGHSAGLSPADIAAQLRAAAGTAATAAGCLAPGVAADAPGPPQAMPPAFHSQQAPPQQQILYGRSVTTGAPMTRAGSGGGTGPVGGTVCPATGGPSMASGPGSGELQVQPQPLLHLTRSGSVTDGGGCGGSWMELGQRGSGSLPPQQPYQQQQVQVQQMQMQQQQVQVQVQMQQQMQMQPQVRQPSPRVMSPHAEQATGGAPLARRAVAHRSSPTAYSGGNDDDVDGDGSTPRDVAAGLYDTMDEGDDGAAAAGGGSLHGGCAGNGAVSAAAAAAGPGAAGGGGGGRLSGSEAAQLASLDWMLMEHLQQ